MSNARIVHVLCALLVVLPGAASAADLTVVSKVTAEGPVARSGTQTMYMTPTKFRISSEQQDVMMDVATGTMTIIDNAKKQYWQMTRADMEAAGRAIADQMAQMQKTNPDAAKMMESMMGATGSASVRKTGTTRTFAGYPCDDYLVTLGEMVKETICATTAVQAPLTAGQFYDAQTAIFGNNPMTKRFAPMFEEMKKIQGLPLAQEMETTMAGMHMKSVTEATEVKTDPIPPSTFEIPSGYTKVDSPMSQMMRGRGRGQR
jgi:Domain of unknown function (DUF4412)